MHVREQPYHTVHDTRVDAYHGLELSQPRYITTYNASVSHSFLSPHLCFGIYLRHFTFSLYPTSFPDQMISQNVYPTTHAGRTYRRPALCMVDNVGG